MCVKSRLIRQFFSLQVELDLWEEDVFFWKTVKVDLFQFFDSKKIGNAKYEITLHRFNL